MNDFSFGLDFMTWYFSENISTGSRKIIHKRDFVLNVFPTAERSGVAEVGFVQRAEPFDGAEGLASGSGEHGLVLILV
ncbi:hypothetical protein [Gordonibacter sp. An230]|uniref:hypothetical protein n=1 Tax=Gordonibacter sp. An230 TaxID=1965592 RepID=UPI00111EDC9C|nr:hypothetical protein [Gordonibacter sp. An230]